MGCLFQPYFPGERIADPMEGAGPENQLGKSVAKPLESAVKKQNWGCALLAGPAVTPILLVATSSSHLQLPQVCCRSRAVPALVGAPALCQQPALACPARPGPPHPWARLTAVERLVGGL